MFNGKFSVNYEFQAILLPSPMYYRPKKLNYKYSIIAYICHQLSLQKIETE